MWRTYILSLYKRENFKDMPRACSAGDPTPALPSWGGGRKPRLGSGRRVRARPFRKPCGSLSNRARPFRKSCGDLSNRARPFGKPCGSLSNRARPFRKSCGDLSNRARPFRKPCGSLSNRFLFIHYILFNLKL